MTTVSMTPTAQPRTTQRPGGTACGVVQLRVGDEAGAQDAWFGVCALALLTPGRGVAILLPDGRQAALFQDRAGGLYAIDNRDPFTGASVLSRGLLGSTAGTPFVASPLLKQRFRLTDGRCLDDDETSVTVYEVRVTQAAGLAARAS